MDLELLFSDSKWNILSELSHSSLSPTELAKRTGTSLANISAQIRLLEALDFIEQEKLSNVARGEPRKLYSLKKEFAYLIIGTRSAIGKKMVRLDADSMPYFAVWLISEPQVPQLLIRFISGNDETLKEAESISYLGMKEDTLELLVIHPFPDTLHHLKAQQISMAGKTIRLSLHIHSLAAMAEGCSRKDEYYCSLVKKSIILKDRNSRLSKLKKGGS